MELRPGLRTHSLPISFAPTREEQAERAHNASATLLWVDRPFAVTVNHVVQQYLRWLEEDPGAEVSIGGLRVEDLRARILCASERHDLATLRLEPEELPHLGDDSTFHNPERWPTRPVEAHDRIVVFGYPRDQWPAQVEYTFLVESSQERRFSAVLEHASMPGRLAGLCGGPAFRLDPHPEFVGVVTEALFHNEVIRCQHALHVDTCGQVSNRGD